MKNNIDEDSIEIDDHYALAAPGWKQGNVVYGEDRYKYQLKLAENPSADYGLEGGRILKLIVIKYGDDWGHAVYNYDRGEDIKARDPKVRKIVDKIVNEYK